MDTERNRYQTIDELIPYCHRVASAVGLVSATIFGATGVAVERYAEELGIALQLTNILRDVAEDAEMDRLYIPREDLERFGVSEEEILREGNGIPSPAMIHLLNHQAERADSRFAKAELAWTEMSANQRRLMRPARLMSAIYRDLLLQMHRDRYDVFAKRYRVSGLKKVFLLLRVASTRS
jgi:phytoene synthase